MSGGATTTDRERRGVAARTVAVRVAWTSAYLRSAALLDCLCALLAGLVALEVRFNVHGDIPAGYLAFTAALPFLWLGSVAMAGGYDPRFIGVGSDEFRRVLNAAVSLTAGVAILSYVAKLDLARGYVVVALPCTAALDLGVRYCHRKRLHRSRRGGRYMRRTVAVGHAGPVEDLVARSRAVSTGGGSRTSGERDDQPDPGTSES